MALLGDFENLSHWHLQYIVIWYLQLNTDKTGARQGLIGKTGEMPARSRHCNAEQLQICHWETGKAGEALKQSQENCLFFVTDWTHERWEGDVYDVSLRSCKGFFYWGFPVWLTEENKLNQGNRCPSGLNREDRRSEEAESGELPVFNHRKNLRAIGWCENVFLASTLSVSVEWIFWWMRRIQGHSCKTGGWRQGTSFSACGWSAKGKALQQ